MSAEIRQGRCKICKSRSCLCGVTHSVEAMDEARWLEEELARRLADPDPDDGEGIAALSRRLTQLLEGGGGVK